MIRFSAYSLPFHTSMVIAGSVICTLLGGCSLFGIAGNKNYSEKAKMSEVTETDEDPPCSIDLSYSGEVQEHSCSFKVDEAVVVYRVYGVKDGMPACNKESPVPRTYVLSFAVNGTFNFDTQIEDSTRRMIALKLWRNISKVTKTAPDGTVFYASVWQNDGRWEHRKQAYESFGFTCDMHNCCAQIQKGKLNGIEVLETANPTSTK